MGLHAVRQRAILAASQCPRERLVRGSRLLLATAFPREGSMWAEEMAWAGYLLCSFHTTLWMEKIMKHKGSPGAGPSRGSPGAGLEKRK